jgi:DNA-binding XRE family transcriptional regulator
LSFYDGDKLDHGAAIRLILPKLSVALTGWQLLPVFESIQSRRAVHLYWFDNARHQTPAPGQSVIIEIEFGIEQAKPAADSKRPPRELEHLQFRAAPEFKKYAPPNSCWSERRLRQSAGMTQEQFSQRSGFSQQYISGLERGRRNPTIVTLCELAAALCVDHVELVRPASDG